MFFLRDGRWEVFPKKISYKEQKIMYDMSDAIYKVNPNYSDVVTTSVVLTPEQIARFELVRGAKDSSMVDIEKYVFDEVVNPLTENNLPQVIQENKAKKRLEALIPWDEITAEELNDLIDDFEEYRIPSNYFVGNIFRYGNQLYRVVQNHISQNDWIPSSTPALYTPIAPPSVIADWVQPTGAHDAYKKGDRVMFNGKIYESLRDGNSWSPSAYLQGWKLIV